MRPFRNILAAAFLIALTAPIFAVEPTPAIAIRLSLALPAQNIDFSDMDLRDENNQPISAPQIRRRFEDVLNQNLNRLLIENLTPLRRAWLAIAHQNLDAFGDWLGRAAQKARRWLWTGINGGTRIAFVVRSTAMTASPADLRWRIAVSNDRFLSLAFLLIASTRLIC